MNAMVIAILNGGIPIDETPCRLAYLPDGRRGAVWRGLAYPLSGTNIIDAGGEAIPPGECRESAPTQRPAQRWNIIDGANPYLIIEGSVLDAEAAATVPDPQWKVAWNFSPGR